MRKKSNYYDLLKHPKWQKKRLEILQLHDFSCYRCGTEDKTLNVHHKYYDKDLKPWDYADITLVCLCDDCHKEIHELQDKIKRQIGKLELGDLDRILGYAQGLESQNYPDINFDTISYEEIEGMGLCWGLSAKSIISHMRNSLINGNMLHEIMKEHGESTS